MSWENLTVKQDTMTAALEMAAPLLSEIAHVQIESNNPTLYYHLWYGGRIVFRLQTMWINNSPPYAKILLTHISCGPFNTWIFQAEWSQALYAYKNKN